MVLLDQPIMSMTDLRGRRGAAGSWPPCDAHHAPGVTDPGLLQQGLPLAQVAAWIEGPAGRLSEHPAVVPPFSARPLALAFLTVVVLGYKGGDPIGKRDAAPTRP